MRNGGNVGYLDLGDAVVLVPGGVDDLRNRLLDAVTEADWRRATDSFGDADLATE
jgi:hypothetical protein